MADGASGIELLDKRNYDVWQLRMKSILVKHDRWGYRKCKLNGSKLCFICGKIGHWAAKCPERQQNSARSVESSEETHYVVDQPEEAHNVTSRSRWCLDSGCTTHMCTSDEFLTDIQECEMTLNMANAASTKARAKGLAHIKAKTDTGNIDLNLRNTLLVKDLRTNLIFVSKITRNDREILFRKDYVIVRDLNGEVKLVADHIGDLYYLREQTEQVKAVEKASERASTSDLDLWHARLGHLHMDDVVNLFHFGFSNSDDPEGCCDGHREVLLAGEDPTNMAIF
ncbi:Similar to RE2: Retrovirus-related Pol polyprotein from transposon RE2 (Arabidopsis thaliana) [Cotesia congregata]|uniref:Similar to RE2: Retrovirus-related Pol polyprotein from transposon RE2 (Arabidopsis thaliana) n=1 Tax=Cotesia congregata TaxID=51543 RepID=A0A8J2MV96_COTCN|nr:Similar to RE2: Retrovirus-related Pol polyprotein from transposon RE2 (Arabidopsis thaliana) [Cotesia congregata]